MTSQKPEIRKVMDELERDIRRLCDAIEKGKCEAKFVGQVPVWRRLVPSSWEMSLEMMIDKSLASDFLSLRQQGCVEIINPTLIYWGESGHDPMSNINKPDITVPADNIGALPLEMAADQHHKLIGKITYQQSGADTSYGYAVPFEYRFVYGLYGQLAVKPPRESFLSRIGKAFSGIIGS
jgi:hypothetical protein